MGMSSAISIFFKEIGKLTSQVFAIFLISIFAFLASCFFALLIAKFGKAKKNIENKMNIN
jgi:NADH:ubiquinone oxidoreductase subunit K